MVRRIIDPLVIRGVHICPVLFVFFPIGGGMAIDVRGVASKHHPPLEHCAMFLGRCKAKETVFFSVWGRRASFLLAFLLCSWLGPQPDSLALGDGFKKDR